MLSPICQTYENCHLTMTQTNTQKNNNFKYRIHVWEKAKRFLMKVINLEKCAHVVDWHISYLLPQMHGMDLHWLEIWKACQWKWWKTSAHITQWRIFFLQTISMHVSIIWFFAAVPAFHCRCVTIYWNIFIKNSRAKKWGKQVSIIWFLFEGIEFLWICSFFSFLLSWKWTRNFLRAAIDENL